MSWCGGGIQKTFFNVSRQQDKISFWHEHKLFIVSLRIKVEHQITKKNFLSTVEKDRVAFRIKDLSSSSLLVSRATQLCHNRIFFFSIKHYTNLLLKERLLNGSELTRTRCKELASGKCLIYVELSSGR